MLKLFALVFVWGPALLGFALGWLVRHPDDWTGPAVVAPVGLAITVLTYRWGVRRRPTLPSDLQPLWLAAMIASAAIGVLVFGMLVLGIIG